MDHLNAGQRGMAAAMVYPDGGDASASTVDLPIPRRGCHNHRSPCRWCGSSPAKAGQPDRSSGVDNGPPEACSGGLFDGHGSKNVCARSLSRKRLESVVGPNRKSSRRAYVFRFTPESGLKSDIPPCPHRAAMSGLMRRTDQTSIQSPRRRGKAALGKC